MNEMYPLQHTTRQLLIGFYIYTYILVIIYAKYSIKITQIINVYFENTSVYR